MVKKFFGRSKRSMSRPKAFNLDDIHLLQGSSVESIATEGASLNETVT